MDAITVGIGGLVAVALLVTFTLLFVLSRLFRKVEQGKALIVSKMRKVDVTRRVTSIVNRDIELRRTRTGRFGLGLALAPLGRLRRGSLHGT
ncbi:hypothetical protein [Streptomyces sp. NBC_01353]|uniref:hypothetical protein n=1 Tax=Streptomyces sp. NBC_01353 TaxID=2903835 RepID=UPI003DA2BD99